jgi:hypothetical protein
MPERITMTYDFDDVQRFTLFGAEPTRGGGTEGVARKPEAADALEEEEERPAAGETTEQAEHA